MAKAKLTAKGNVRLTISITAAQDLRILMNTFGEPDFKRQTDLEMQSNRGGTRTDWEIWKALHDLGSVTERPDDNEL